MNKTIETLKEVQILLAEYLAGEVFVNRFEINDKLTALIAELEAQEPFGYFDEDFGFNYPEFFSNQEKLVRTGKLLHLYITPKQCSKLETSCDNCNNRGKINGLSQETFCEQCSESKHLINHYKEK